MEYSAFPDKQNAILSNSIKAGEKVDAESCGNLGLLIDGKCQKTFPNQTMKVNWKLDWCSNIGKSKEDKPWIVYSIQNKMMRLSSFSVRNGCCYYLCCCEEDDKIVDTRCCCDLYSYALQGSNDKKNWNDIKVIEKDPYFEYCTYKTFDFPMTDYYKYIRFILNEEMR